MSEIKIVLVNDEKTDAMDIKRSLKSFNYHVPFVASSGEEALSKILEIMPDLILIDIMLKGNVDAFELASKIKNLNKYKLSYLLIIIDKLYENLIYTCLKIAASSNFQACIN